MTLEQITSSSPIFEDAWNIYENSFPEDERRTFEQQRMTFTKPEYAFYVVQEQDRVQGLLAAWNFGGFSFIEHLATKKELRGRGLGTDMLKKYVEKAPKPVVLEVDRPVEGSDARDLINFYRKREFNLNPGNDYIQPSYGPGKKSVRMFLMSTPGRLSTNEFKGITREIHSRVYNYHHCAL